MFFSWLEQRKSDCFFLEVMNFSARCMGYLDLQVCSSIMSLHGSHSACSIYLLPTIGRHCCLWCLIDSSQMAKPAAERTPSQQRSLDQLITDFRKFTESGSNIKRAKFYNNVIRPHLLAVPIDHGRAKALS